MKQFAELFGRYGSGIAVTLGGLCIIAFVAGLIDEDTKNLLLGFFGVTGGPGVIVAKRIAPPYALSRANTAKTPAVKAKSRK